MQRNRGQLRLRTPQRTLLAQHDFRIGLPVAQKLGDIFHHIQPVIAQRKLQPVRPGIALAVLHMEQGRFQTHGLFFFQPQTWRRTHPKMRQQLLHRGGGTVFHGNQRRWRQIPGHCAVAACLRRVIVPPVALNRLQNRHDMFAGPVKFGKGRAVAKVVQHLSRCIQFQFYII